MQFITNGGQSFPLTAQQANQLWPQYEGKQVVLGIRLENISDTADCPNKVYRQMEGTIAASEGLGHYTILYLMNEDGEFSARVQPHHTTPVNSRKVLYYYGAHTGYVQS